MFNLKKSTLVLALCGCSLMSLPLVAEIGLTRIVTDQAPKAVGPYSQGVVAGSYVSVAGQVAIDPANGKLANENVEMETRRVLKNIEAILAVRGLTLENVIETTVYLTDLKDFAALNKVFAEEFHFDVKPTRATVQVSALPLGARVEIVCKAYISN